MVFNFRKILERGHAFQKGGVDLVKVKNKGKCVRFRQKFHRWFAPIFHFLRWIGFWRHKGGIASCILSEPRLPSYEETQIRLQKKRICNSKDNIKAQSLLVSNFCFCLKLVLKCTFDLWKAYIQATTFWWNHSFITLLEYFLKIEKKIRRLVLYVLWDSSKIIMENMACEQ